MNYDRFTNINIQMGEFKLELYFRRTHNLDRTLCPTLIKIKTVQF